ncbi:unnamed protein product [Diamesa tonsa]
MKSYLRFIVVALVLVVVEQSVVGYPIENFNDCELSPLNRPQRKADPNMALLMAFTSKNKSKLPLSSNNEDELAIGRALENPSDVICMHKKYAIMLNKFLDAMHCNQDKTTTEKPLLRVHESKDKEGRRHERNNEKVAQRVDTFETVVSNNVELKSKASSKDKPTEAIMQLFKQLHEFENKNKQYQSEASIVSGNNIQKRTDVDSISASEISMSNEDEDDEILNQRLLQQLKALFQEYELSQDNGEDETFLQSNENASGSIVQRSSKKSNRKTAVQEDSTESTEATVILKKHKNETKSTQLKENLRKSNTSNASDSPARNSIRKHSNRNDSTDNTTTKIRRRTSSNHKSSNDNREKLSLNVKIPKSSNILVKKIKWD